MKRTLTIEQKKSELEASLQRLTVIQEVLDILESNIEYYRAYEYDEDGHRVYDSITGDAIRRDPTPDDICNYPQWKARKDFINELYSLI